MAPQVVSICSAVIPKIGSSETSFMVTAARFTRGVLRPGERCMFYSAEKVRANAILSSNTLPFYVLDVAGGLQAVMSLNPAHLSSYISR